MLPLIFPARVEDSGGIRVDNRPAFDRAMKTLVGTRVVVQIEREQNARSWQQLKYHWGLVLKMIADETGQDTEAIHDDACERFLTTRHVVYLNRQTGEVEERDVHRRTTGLTAKEFAEFVDRVRQWAGEWLGIVIPDPDPSWKNHDAAPR
jgi:hypothetical protein